MRLVTDLLAPAIIAIIMVLDAAAVRAGIRPEEVLVIANQNVRLSVQLAREYMKLRDIPESHLIKLWVTDNKSIEREAFEKKVVTPVRRRLEEVEKTQPISCLLLMYGMPLGVKPPDMTTKEKQRFDEMDRKRKKMAEEANGLEPEEDKARIKEIRREIGRIDQYLGLLRKIDQWASVDSELMLVTEPAYPLKGWQPNPVFAGFSRETRRLPNWRVLYVSRLDGPSPEIVQRIMDDTLWAEKNGMKGKAYFDARYPYPDPQKKQTGYKLYDRSIHEAAKIVRQSTRMDLILDDQSSTFAVGQCPDTALYIGWYSRARYIDSFTWERGSVGMHIASQECQSLTRGNFWCKRMLEEGAAAVVGPIREPYVQAFPFPHLFVANLLEKKMPLAEAYTKSIPYVSWRMVLVGDPLYRLNIPR